LFQKIKGQFLLLWNAIAKTYAENSLKLIALKDLLESYLKKYPQNIALSEESIEVMTLMDELL
jgi:phycocyanobilin lyase alpha subunit